MKRTLMKNGMMLFLLGLLTGLAVPALRNPRMGLSAHLEGVLNGMFLLVVGLVWDELGFKERTRKAAYALVLVGTWANWGATLLSGILGTSRFTPLAGAGFHASDAAELLVGAILVLVSVAMVVALGLFFAGLRGERPSSGTVGG